jgi:hypothetical protein
VKAVRISASAKSLVVAISSTSRTYQNHQNGLRLLSEQKGRAVAQLALGPQSIC